MRRHRHGIWGGGRFMNGGAAGRLPPDVVHQRALAVTACACAHAAAAGHDPGRTGRPAAGPGKPEHGWLARPAQVPGLGARHPEHGRAGHRHLRTARAAHHWCAGAGPERLPLTPPGQLCPAAPQCLRARPAALRRSSLPASGAPLASQACVNRFQYCAAVSSPVQGQSSDRSPFGEQAWPGRGRWRRAARRAPYPRRLPLSPSPTRTAARRPAAGAPPQPCTMLPRASAEGPCACGA